MALNFSVKSLWYLHFELKQQLRLAFLLKKMLEQSYDDFLIVSAIKKMLE